MTLCIELSDTCLTYDLLGLIGLLLLIFLYVIQFGPLFFFLVQLSPCSYENDPIKSFSLRLTLTACSYMLCVSL